MLSIKCTNAYKNYLFSAGSEHIENAEIIESASDEIKVDIDSCKEIAVSVSKTGSSGAFGISEGSLGAAESTVPCSQSVGIKLLELVDVLAGNTTHKNDVLAGNTSQDITAECVKATAANDSISENAAENNILASSGICIYLQIKVLVKTIYML